MPADKTTATPAASAPIGTPPAGGRWTWDGAAWVRLPETDEAAAPAAAAPAALNTPKE